MAKKIKFNLIVDGVRCKNIEDIQNNFNVLDLIEYLKSGKLLRWAKVRNLDELVMQLENINSEDDMEIAKKLCEIFEIDCDENDLADELNIQTIGQLLNDKDITESLKQLKDIDNRIKKLEEECFLNKSKKHTDFSDAFADVFGRDTNTSDENTNTSNEKTIYFKYVNNLGLLVRDEVIEMSKTDDVMLYLQTKLGNGWRLPYKQELEIILSQRHKFRNIKQITNMDLVYIRKDANFNKKYVIAVKKFGDINSVFIYTKSLELRHIQPIVEPI